MSCAQDRNYHSAEPRSRQQEGNGMQTAACQTLICLPAVVRAADNIDALCDISGDTWQDGWGGTCLQDYSRWTVLPRSSVSCVLTAGTVTPHVPAHLLTKLHFCHLITSGASFIMTRCCWDITHARLQKGWRGRLLCRFPEVHRWPPRDYGVINVNKYVLVCASGRVFMHLFQSAGRFQRGRTTQNTTLH